MLTINGPYNYIVLTQRSVGYRCTSYCIIFQQLNKHIQACIFVIGVFIQLPLCQPDHTLQVLNHNQSEHYANLMGFIVVLKGVWSKELHNHFAGKFLITSVGQVACTCVSQLPKFRSIHSTVNHFYIDSINAVIFGTGCLRTKMWFIRHRMICDVE